MVRPRTVEVLRRVMESTEAIGGKLRSAQKAEKVRLESRWLRGTLGMGWGSKGVYLEAKLEL